MKKKKKKTKLLFLIVISHKSQLSWHPQLDLNPQPVNHKTRALTNAPTGANVFLDINLFMQGFILTLHVSSKCLDDEETLCTQSIMLFPIY